MRAGFGVDAIVGQAQAFDWFATDKMLLYDFGGIAGLNVSVPDGFGIDDDNRAVLALIKAQRLVDADFGSEAGGFRQLLQLSEDFALSVCGA
jgi:hypothetical protein